MPAPVNLELQRSGRIFGHLLVLNNLFASLEDDRGDFVKSEGRFVSLTGTFRLGNETQKSWLYGNLSSRIGTQLKIRGPEVKPTTQEAEPVAASCHCPQRDQKTH